MTKKTLSAALDMLGWLSLLALFALWMSLDTVAVDRALSGWLGR